jgi:hypothetical protein
MTKNNKEPDNTAKFIGGALGGGVGAVVGGQIGAAVGALLGHWATAEAAKKNL